MKNEVLRILLSMVSAFLLGEHGDAAGVIEELRKARARIDSAIREAQKAVRVERRFAARASRAGRRLT